MAPRWTRELEHLPAPRYRPAPCPWRGRSCGLTCLAYIHQHFNCLSAPLQSANALSFDELQGLTYLQVKGSGIANTCPTLSSGSSNVKDLKAGSYKLEKFCMEPTSFTVKEESQASNAPGCATSADAKLHCSADTMCLRYLLCCTTMLR